MQKNSGADRTHHGHRPQDQRLKNPKAAVFSIAIHAVFEVTYTIIISISAYFVGGSTTSSSIAGL